MDPPLEIHLVEFLSFYWHVNLEPDGYQLPVYLRMKLHLDKMHIEWGREKEGGEGVGRYIHW